MAYEEAKTGLGRSLRKRMTFAERRLWSRLRKSQLGLRWLRQEPFGKYIVDFYCPVARLVVELDGNAHALTAEYDFHRQSWLEGQGVKVLRFANWTVENNIDCVLEEIAKASRGHIVPYESNME